MLEIKKRYTYAATLVLFFFISIPSWAIYQSSTFGNRSGIATGCTTQIAQETYGQDLSFGRDLATDPIYVWSTFTTTGAFTGYTFYVSLKKAGTPAVNMQLNICTVTGGNPLSCTTADAVVSSSALTTDYQWIKYNIAAGYSFSAATQYGIRLFWDGAVGLSDYALWGYDIDETGQYVKLSPDGTNWTVQDGSGQGLMRIKDCNE